MFSLVFSRRYSMAHRLRAGRSSKCMTPHGHNETVVVRLVAASPERLDGEANMVEPFAEAKALWHRWIDDHVDHALQLSADDPLLDYLAAHEPTTAARVLVCPGDPTTEVLAACFLAKIGAFLRAAGGRLNCVELSVEETPTNRVTLTGRAADALPFRAVPAPRIPWWERADMSINDLTLPTREACPPLRLANAGMAR
jgi:6-pyruvoyltetrahydropterin/6-carboxytetrahydropterin synthase